MPNRIIKESICTSDNLDQLSAFQETMFYRLLVNCDDYGRMDARPKILAAKLFPLKDIRTSQIEEGLRALTSAELVIIYEVDGKPFLQMKTWERHQQIRAKKSKYPSPESGNIVSDSTCKQMIADDSKCPRNPIQSESNPNPESESNSNPVSVCNARAREGAVGNPQPSPKPDRWEEFWDAYPRKSGGDIREACMEYLKAIDAGADPAVLIAAAKALAARTDRDTFRYLPKAEKWLRNRGWLEKPPDESEDNRTNNIFLQILDEERGNQ